MLCRSRHTLRVKPTLQASMTSPPLYHTSIVARADQSPLRLPRLPVPDLHKTVQKYVQSLVPLLQEQEARGGPSAESAVNERLEWAAAFEAGLGAQCQRRLTELDEKSPRNWLDDNFWLKKAYHEWRAPLLINSNWWLVLFNDSTVPRDVLEQRSFSSVAGLSFWQVRRAAWMVHRVLEFKNKLQGQALYPDTTRTGVWFREAVDKMFYTSRIPQRNCDVLSPQPPLSSPDTRKIILNVDDWLYAVDVYAVDGTALAPAEIEQRMLEIVKDVETRLSNGQRPVPVSILTSDDRDRWADNLTYLKSLSAKNASILRTIRDSVFAVSLDAHSSPTAHALDTPPEINAHLHNVRSSRNGRNRWFDKAFTLIVESNTRAGVTGEHSPCDALVPSIVGEYAVVESIDPSVFPPLGHETEIIGEGWERLDFVTDEHLRKECAEAEERAVALIADSDAGVHWFAEYGADWIKNTARLSPDAYVQMALQLAWYKTRGSFTATYETVLTRAFDHGRTETIRSLTADSRAFVLAMLNPSTSTQTRHELLHRAIQTHTALTRQAAAGKGIDRHLLGLRQMLQNGERSDLFDDPLFEQSQTWKLSTSGLSAGHLFRGTGFGASYTDGYGINYLCGSDMIKFGVECKISCPETSTVGFHAAISVSLQEMKEVCSAVVNTTNIMSRL